MPWGIFGFVKLLKFQKSVFLHSLKTTFLNLERGCYVTASCGQRRFLKFSKFAEKFVQG